MPLVTKNATKLTAWELAEAMKATSDGEVLRLIPSSRSERISGLNALVSGADGPAWEGRCRQLDKVGEMMKTLRALIA